MWGTAKKSCNYGLSNCLLAEEWHHHFRAFSPWPVQQWSVFWAGSKEMKRKSGQKRQWTHWWKSWRNRKALLRILRKLWAAQVRWQSVSPFPVLLMAGFRCHTAKVFPMSFTAEFGAGLICSLIMSWSLWTAVNIPSHPNRKVFKCASTPTTTNVLKAQVVLWLRICVRLRISRGACFARLTDWILFEVYSFAIFLCVVSISEYHDSMLLCSKMIVIMNKDFRLVWVYFVWSVQGVVWSLSVLS